MVGKKIKRLRTELNITQLDFELAIDLANGSLSRIESGKIEPSKETLKKIITFFKLDSFQSNYLLGLNTDIPTKDEVKSAIDTVNKYFKNKNTVAYLRDDRWSIHAISEGIADFFSITKSEASSLIGKNALAENFKPGSVFHYKYSKKHFLTFAKFIVARIKRDLKDLQEEVWIKEMLTELKTYKTFSDLWNSEEKFPEEYFSYKSKINVFDIDGIEKTVIYSKEQLNSSRRFYVIDFVEIKNL